MDALLSNVSLNFNLRPCTWVLHDSDGCVNVEAGMVFKRQPTQTGIEGCVRHVGGGAGPATRSLLWLVPASCLLGETISVNISQIAQLESCIVRESSPES
jgi:hypothetical protein